ncbi:MAG TPA: Mrp/NBP35 family ATP-binding protein [Acidimicrobiales bacterium]|jgi:ATP-binding protein involved in chromosome partitioning|nr:Mrp/NBP35 family ATP-binding protein [Actinomycetes bacterium]MDP6104819.1 Mrp/NBP35 family ATP-binding protein [Acidimicrobiales bacterium]MDP7352927.1 Mrp/NBP35 family ATP-binding protein [Acidimicrobiales bacterium]MDP7507639.1 Mrp/NBP35 family ATP-binding protein [Acidimicrobiales bacterium]HJM31846.1 Mrp/NBP35 family ATP-binding protein [Acidimicrobiales bacterium]|tara:strand:- start:6230 stop:7411 length:1182 start_codon:yes stop_codon:yes gene_type:complete
MPDGPSSMVRPPSIEAVMALLRGVVDPELGSDIVELGMAKGATVDADGLVDVTIALTTSGCPLRAQIQRDVRARIGGLPGVTKVHITWTELTPEEKAAAMSRARWNVAQDSPETAVPATCRVLMVASGKGGVGKSSVTVNLATALADRGFAVGVMDADIWGFSVPRMLGIEGRLGGSPESGRITPNRRPVGAGHLEVVSMGFLVEDEETALMWRGLILNRAVQHFCEDVEWGDLDYLLIDMPPGTGDVQMGLARMLPRAEMVIVTTPALAAQKVAVRVAHMGRNNYLRVVGVIENMSAYVTPDGERHELFGAGGGNDLAEQIGAPLLGSIPIDATVTAGGDSGRPVVLGEGPAADAYREIVELIATEAAPPINMEGCSARLLAAAEAALDEAG